MIRSFRDKFTSEIFDGRCPKTFSVKIFPAARRKLQMVDAADVLADLNAPPGNRLEALKGARAGQHSIRINGQWRICFVWSEDGPRDVEVVDYHDE